MRTVPQIINEERCGWRRACAIQESERAPEQAMFERLGDQPFALKYRIETAATPEGMIVQEMHDGARLLSRWIMDTREAGIRAALVSLGWNPPEMGITKNGKWPVGAEAVINRENDGVGDCKAKNPEGPL